MHITPEQAAALLQLAAALDACKAQGITVQEFLGNVCVHTAGRTLAADVDLTGAMIRAVHA